MAYLDRAKALPQCQSAYRRLHSTETALLKIYTDICEGLDHGKAALLGLLDLSAAFDTVDHSILLQRLESTYGIRDGALRWFSSYLNGRAMRVDVGHDVSDLVCLSSGVPQGSVLGPQLFLLYSADVSTLTADFGFCYHGYADDTQIYRIFDLTQQSIDEVARDFAACVGGIHEWCKVNRLQLNAAKTEFLWIHSANRNDFVFPDVQLSTGFVQPVKSARSLGVHMDEHLNGADNIGYVSRSCFYQLRQLKTVRKHLDDDTIKSALQAFVSSRLDYCNALFIGQPQYRINRLQRIQNSAARIYARTSRRDSISPVLRELHWLPVRARIHFKTAVIVYKILHNLAPPYLSDMISSTQSVLGGHCLRSVSKGDISATRHFTSRYGNRLFTVSAPAVWNMLPSSVRQSETVGCFGRRLKTFLFRRCLME